MKVLARALLLGLVLRGLALRPVVEPRLKRTPVLLRSAGFAPRAAAAAPLVAAPTAALALGSGDGFGDAAGSLTGVAWVDGLAFLTFCGVGGLLYLTTRPELFSD